MRKLSVFLGVILLAFFIAGCGRQKTGPCPYNDREATLCLACVDGKIFIEMRKYVGNHPEYEWPEGRKQNGFINKTIDVTKEFYWENGSWTKWNTEGKGFPYVYADKQNEILLVNRSTGDTPKLVIMYYFCDAVDFSWDRVFP